jgi:hypothetical protein
LQWGQRFILRVRQLTQLSIFQIHVTQPILAGLWAAFITAEF